MQIQSFLIHSKTPPLPFPTCTFLKIQELGKGGGIDHSYTIYAEKHRPYPSGSGMLMAPSFCSLSARLVWRLKRMVSM